MRNVHHAISSKNARLLIFMLLDAVCLVLSLLVASLLWGNSFSVFLSLITTEWFFPVGTLVCLYLIYTPLHLYRFYLPSFGITEAIRVCVAVALLTACTLLYVLLYPGTMLDWRFPLLFGGILLIEAGGGRSLKRLAALLYHRFVLEQTKGERTMIVGAGKAGAVLLREMQTSAHLSLSPVCFVDDDEYLQNAFIGNVPIAGTTADIPHLVHKYNVKKIVIAIPTAKKSDIKRIHEICLKTKCPVQIVPGIYQLVNGQVSVSSLRDIDVSDLLGREQTSIDIDQIIGYIEGKTVMVTGGGGSIGSELCRQIASHKPKKLIILDIYENNCYDIQQELLRKYPDLPLLALIASVRDENKINQIFDSYRPDIVFHAAAHKHVPLMETSPTEAIKNNVFGTRNVAAAADRYGVKRFVMISTDKAVNPTNIMGATKRICEMIVQTMGRHSKTEFVAVRFGNVLGSNGSVIPLFRKQIAEGGPVTLTHPDIIRYFMTIPEAVSLVLQAGAYAKGGEIFVLDMGEPVKIYDLAYNLIKLSGYKPNEDIEIKITGLRPGEKLYEERLMAEEGLQKTENEQISIGKPLEIDEEKLFDTLNKLKQAAYDDSPELRPLVKELVPTFQYQ